MIRVPHPPVVAGYARAHDNPNPRPVPGSPRRCQRCPPQCAAAWSAAVKLTAGGQIVDHATMMRIAKSVAGAPEKASMSALPPYALVARRAMLAAHFGLA